MIKNISSIKNPTVMQISALKTEGTKDAFLIEGEKFIGDTDPKNILKIFSTDRAVCEKFEKTGAECFEVSESVLKKLSCETSKSRIVAVVKKGDSPLPEKLLLLDGIQDPGNVGTMIRTAHAFGFGVICGGGTANPFLPKAVRSTAGALCGAFVERRDLAEYIPYLKSEGYTVCGSALDKKAVAPKKADGKTALVIGSEGRGMSESVAESCDETFFIPIKNVESLNAATAAGILMYVLGGN